MMIFKENSFCKLSFEMYTNFSQPHAHATFVTFSWWQLKCILVPFMGKCSFCTLMLWTSVKFVKHECVKFSYNFCFICNVFYSIIMLWEFSNKNEAPQVWGSTCCRNNNYDKKSEVLNSPWNVIIFVGGGVGGGRGEPSYFNLKSMCKLSTPKVL